MTITHNLIYKFLLQTNEAGGVGGIVRLSYAQVAQHPKDKQSMERSDKQITTVDDEKKEVLPATTAQPASRGTIWIQMLSAIIINISNLKNVKLNEVYLY